MRKHNSRTEFWFHAMWGEDVIIKNKVEKKYKKKGSAAPSSKCGSVELEARINWVLAQLSFTERRKRSSFKITRSAVLGYRVPNLSPIKEAA